MLLYSILALVFLTSIPPHLLPLLYLSFTSLSSSSCPLIFSICLSPYSSLSSLSPCPPLHVLTNFLSSSKLPFLRLLWLISLHSSLHPVALFGSQLRSGETAAIVARELAEQTKGLLRPGDVPSTVRAMAQLVELLDVQLRNLTPGGKDSAARSLTKVMQPRTLTGGHCIVSDWL